MALVVTGTSRAINKLYIFSMDGMYFMLLFIYSFFLLILNYHASLQGHPTTEEAFDRLTEEFIIDRGDGI